MLKKVLFIVFLSASALSCVSRLPIEKYDNLVSEEAFEDSNKNETVQEVIIDEYQIPENEFASIQEEELLETPVEIVHSKVNEFIIIPNQETFLGGAVVYLSLIHI